MSNRREVLACLFSCVSSWLQFDRIKPNCRWASQLVCSLFQHSCSLFSPSFCWQYKSWKKEKRKRKSRNISPWKVQSLAGCPPFFPYNQIFLSFCRSMQTETRDYRGPCSNYTEWYMKTRCTCVKISLSQRVLKSKDSEKNAENVGPPMTSRAGQFPSSCKQLEVGF